MPALTITIERFKNIDNVTLEVDGLSLLVGGNNSGKSSALQAIQLGVAIAQTSKLQRGKWKSDTLSTSIGQSELLYSPLRNVFLLSRNHRLSTAKDSGISISYKNPTHNTSIRLAKGKNKNVSIEVTGEHLGKTLQSLDKPFSALVTGLAGIPSFEEYETPYVVRKTAAMGNSNSVFRNILLTLHKTPPNWARFASQLQEVFPQYEIKVEFDPDKDEAIRCIAKQKGIDFPIDSCGTGLLQTIQILSYLNLFQPALLLLDEPDSHLHPNNQKRLARVLNRISNNGTNVIIATHSRHMVRELLPSADFYWMRSGGVASRRGIDDYEISALLDIGALDAGEQLEGPALIMLCEDERCDLLKTLMDASGFSRLPYEVLPYQGCSNVVTARAIIKALRLSHPSAVYAIHRDRDFLPQEAIDEFLTEFSALNVHVFITDRNDLESYFVEPTHVSRTCDVSEADAETIIASAFHARRDELISKYVNTLTDQKHKQVRSGSPGQFAADAVNAFANVETAPVHGKILLSGVRDVLRSQGKPDRLLDPATAPSVAKLIELAEMFQRLEVNEAVQTPPEKEITNTPILSESIVDLPLSAPPAQGNSRHEIETSPLAASERGDSSEGKS